MYNTKIRFQRSKPVLRRTVRTYNQWTQSRPRHRTIIEGSHYIIIVLCGNLTYDMLRNVRW